jgi:osmotically-inducible protein OsmY
MKGDTMLRTGENVSERIREEVSRLLQADARIDTRDITIDVEDDKVILKGSVASYAERRDAESDAAVAPDVREVDNRLLVKHPEVPSLSDEALRKRITDLLAWNSNLDSSKIAVTVQEGVVILDGTVNSYWEKFKAQEIAENVQGVADVDNDISITPTQAFEDEAITEAVTAEMERNLRGLASSVEVRVDSGVVTLNGNVPDRSLYRIAHDIALFTDGVMGVVNNLIIQPTS